MKLTRFYDLLARIHKSPEAELRIFLDTQEAEVFSELGKELTNFVLDTDFTNVLTDTGVVTERSFFRELLYRLNRKFFPPVHADREFRSTLRELDNKFDFTDLILTLQKSTISEFLEKTFTLSPLHEKRFRQKLFSAFKIVTTRLIYQCTSRQIFTLLDTAPNLKEQVIDLDKSSHEFLETPNVDTFSALRSRVDSCEKIVEFIRDHKKDNGISLDVTFRLMAIFDLVKRIKILLVILSPTETAKSKVLFEIAHLFQRILRLEKESSQLKALFTEYIELVSYQITEHTGRIGEDYIQSDKSGSLRILKKGLVGGVIVGLFAFLKPMLAEVSLPPLYHALGFSLIYSSIFLLIYFLGGVLATKQPAMTAARLANALDEAKPSAKFLWDISTLIRDTTRSQFLALSGNFIVALPVASITYYFILKMNLFTFEHAKAEYLVHSLHPLFSFSLVYAALTGVCLAISGIAAGALRNWYIFNKIERRLRTGTPFDKIFGPERCATYMSFLDSHLEGLVSNISLGFMLGFLSVAGSVLGLPIDIRHITFASAQVGVVLMQPGFEISNLTLFVTLVGVFLIGIINLAVSFYIMFFIAFKSRRLTFDQGKRLFKILASRFFKEPTKFFIPTDLDH